MKEEKTKKQSSNDVCGMCPGNDQARIDITLSVPHRSDVQGWREMTSWTLSADSRDRPRCTEDARVRKKSHNINR